MEENLMGAVPKGEGLFPTGVPLTQAFQTTPARGKVAGSVHS